jgi:hypothetical protein
MAQKIFTYILVLINSFLLTNPQLLFGKGINDLVFEKYRFEAGHELADMNFSGTSDCILDLQKPSKRNQYPKKTYGLDGNRDWQYIPWRHLRNLEALDFESGLIFRNLEKYRIHHLKDKSFELFRVAGDCPLPVGFIDDGPQIKIFGLLKGTKGFRPTMTTISKFDVSGKREFVTSSKEFVLDKFQEILSFGLVNIKPPVVRIHWNSKQKDTNHIGMFYFDAAAPFEQKVGMNDIVVIDLDRLSKIYASSKTYSIEIAYRELDSALQRNGMLLTKEFLCSQPCPKSSIERICAEHAMERRLNSNIDDEIEFPFENENPLQRKKRCNGFSVYKDQLASDDYEEWIEELAQFKASQKETIQKYIDGSLLDFLVSETYAKSLWMQVHPQLDQLQLSEYRKYVIGKTGSSKAAGDSFLHAIKNRLNDLLTEIKVWQKKDISKLECRDCHLKVNKANLLKFLDVKVASFQEVFAKRVSFVRQNFKKNEEIHLDYLLYLFFLEGEFKSGFEKEDIIKLKNGKITLDQAISNYSFEGIED